jgi:alginate O-acetyltransferase complex protein AlgI
MLFNSSSFLLFFPLVTVGYFLLPFRLRWVWLLLASCIFYMYFIPAYILILAFTIFVDYFAGLLIAGSEGRLRKIWLGVSIAANVGVLAIFKYADFIAGNLGALARFLHWNYSIPTLSLILPIGLSFHTFQAMSYTIEVYKGRFAPERHLGIYALYVMFYPQLVAGPIERPLNLIPQLRAPHAFEYARVADGLRLMAWGFFKKLVIADRLAKFVNPVYYDPARHSGPELLFATISFAFQIYGDFSGYSDIAIGAARVMGIDLMQNFRAPYWSLSITDFWRRWHISLSSWFRDYLYFPLGGSRRGIVCHLRNLMVVFVLSGLWHGANWTFVIWGALHGVFVSAAAVIRELRQRIRGATEPGHPARRLVSGLQAVTTFALVDVAWIFFRARTVSDAWYILTHLHHGWQWPGREAIVRLLSNPMTRLSVLNVAFTGAAVVIMLIAEATDPERAFLGVLDHGRWWVRWPAYYALVAVILIFGVFERSKFLYFQF